MLNLAYDLKGGHIADDLHVLFFEGEDAFFGEGVGDRLDHEAGALFAVATLACFDYVEMFAHAQLLRHLI